MRAPTAANLMYIDSLESLDMLNTTEEDNINFRARPIFDLSKAIQLRR